MVAPDLSVCRIFGVEHFRGTKMHPMGVLDSWHFSVGRVFRCVGPLVIVSVEHLGRRQNVVLPVLLRFSRVSLVAADCSLPAVALCTFWWLTRLNTPFGPQLGLHHYNSLTPLTQQLALLGHYTHHRSSRLPSKRLS